MALALNGNSANGNNGNGNGTQDKPTGGDAKKTGTVVKQFVAGFSREDFKPLVEHEVNRLDYCHVNSDKARLSVLMQGIGRGSASMLIVEWITPPISGKDCAGYRSCRM